MPGKSPFEEEHRECLRAHYMHVIREKDARTERTLKGVLKELGFREDEIAELKVLATAHVDDSGSDFVPDPAIVEQIAAVTAAAAANEAALNPGGVQGDGEPVPAEIAAQDLHLAGRHVGADDPAVIEAALKAAEEAAKIEASIQQDDVSPGVHHDDEPPAEDAGAVQLSLF